MNITGPRIQQLAPRVYGSIATALAEVLMEEMPKRGLATILRGSCFMGQFCYESQYFSRFEENLNYSAERIAVIFKHLAGRAEELAGHPQALANAAYANKDGNGDEASGDGWLFRGRGGFQLTGRANYAAAGAALGLDLVGDPGQVATPDGAVKTALWFWDSRHCSALADLNDIRGVTAKINPELLGLDVRTKLTEDSMRIFA